MGVDVGGTLAGLDALGRRVDESVRQIVADAAHIFQAKAMQLAPVGVTGNSTNSPGDLKRSMDVEGPFGGDGTYVARMGPTVTTANPGRGGHVFNFGRQREFGGEIRPALSPYLVFTKFGTIYRRQSVYQEGSHYLGRARVEAEPDVMVMVDERLTIAVKGG